MNGNDTDDTTTGDEVAETEGPVQFWLDQDTAPLPVYRDRDLPFAPLTVQRERGVPPGRGSTPGPESAAPPSAPPSAAPAVAGPMTGAGQEPTVVGRRADRPSLRSLPPRSDQVADATPRPGMSVRVGIGIATALLVVGAALAVVIGGGPPGAQPGGAATGSGHAIPPEPGAGSGAAGGGTGSGH